MSNVWFTSDLHLGHRRVAGLRGFASAVDHDAVVLANWQRAVHNDDVVWVLGDLCMGFTETALEQISALPGRKRLIFGNHDAGHPRHRDAYRWADSYRLAFEHVAASARIRLQGREVLLSHFPYERDRGEARHLQWRLPDLGTPLLHGHTHGIERASHSLRGTLELHVGLDAWDLRPVSDADLAQLWDQADSAEVFNARAWRAAGGDKGDNSQFWQRCTILSREAGRLAEVQWPDGRKSRGHYLSAMRP